MDSLIDLAFPLFEDFRFDGLAELGEDLLQLALTPGMTLEFHPHIIAERRRRGRHQSSRASLKLTVFLLMSRLELEAAANGSCSLGSQP